MITKVQGKTLASGFAVRKVARMSALEKGMVKWAVVDQDDKLLDANIGSGVMAEYLRRNMMCEVCGVSDNMEHVRYARSRLRSCDIVYAAQGDIPWREEAFDTVLMKLRGESGDTLRRMLGEALRVLKPGGQLVLGTACFPASTLSQSGEERTYFHKRPVCGLLAELKFHNVTWQRTSVATGVMIAWKERKPEVEEALKNDTETETE